MSKVTLRWGNGYEETVDLTNSDRITITNNRGASQYYSHSGELQGWSPRNTKFPSMKKSWWERNNEKIFAILSVIVIIFIFIIFIFAISKRDEEMEIKWNQTQEDVYDSIISQFHGVSRFEDMLITEEEGGVFTVNDKKTNKVYFVKYNDNGEYKAEQAWP